MSGSQTLERHCTCDLQGDIDSRVGEILKSYSGDRSELLPILQQIQEQLGYLPEEAMCLVASFLHIPESTVFGVGTFYAQFKLVPSARNVVKVCRGTACHVRGGARILRDAEKELGIKSGETTTDGEYSLETVACFGACALGPVMVVNNKLSARMTKQKVKKTLQGDKKP